VTAVVRNLLKLSAICLDHVCACMPLVEPLPCQILSKIRAWGKLIDEEIPSSFNEIRSQTRSKTKGLMRGESCRMASFLLMPVYLPAGRAGWGHAPSGGVVGPDEDGKDIQCMR
jgi:hypothetical protein